MLPYTGIVCSWHMTRRRNLLPSLSTFYDCCCRALSICGWGRFRLKSRSLHTTCAPATNQRAPIPYDTSLRGSWAKLLAPLLVSTATPRSLLDASGPLRSFPCTSLLHDGRYGRRAHGQPAGNPLRAYEGARGRGSVHLVSIERDMKSTP